MTKKEMMRKISEVVGPLEATKLVVEAYNSEILSNRMSRMETAPSAMPNTGKKDLLQKALERVIEVIDLL